MAIRGRRRRVMMEFFMEHGTCRTWFTQMNDLTVAQRPEPEEALADALRVTTGCKALARCRTTRLDS